MTEGHGEQHPGGPAPAAPPQPSMDAGAGVQLHARAAALLSVSSGQVLSLSGHLRSVCSSPLQRCDGHKADSSGGHPGVHPGHHPPSPSSQAKGHHSLLPTEGPSCPNLPSQAWPQILSPHAGQGCQAMGTAASVIRTRTACGP
jgi:hypothetical protein